MSYLGVDKGGVDMPILRKSLGVDKLTYFRGRQGGGRQADLRIFLGVDMPGVDMVTKGVDMLILTRSDIIMIAE